MYATIKTIPAWNNKMVTPIYTINAICMGTLTVYCFTRFYEFEINYLYHLTVASLIMCLFLKLMYWYIVSKNSISTANSATGLGKDNNISLFEGLIQEKIF